MKLPRYIDMNIGNGDLMDNLIRMSGLSDWTEKLPNGQYKLFIPKDMNSPSKDNSYEITVKSQTLLNAYQIMKLPKQYTTDGNNVIKEGDEGFDINKWVELMVKQISK